MAMEKIYYLSFHGLFLLSFLLSCSAFSTTNISTDQSALLALRAHITSEPYKILANNWSVASSVCDWKGVTCGSRHQRVTALNIANMENSNTHLRRLRILNFTDNNLSGELPSWFGSLGKLKYLSLGTNSFTGFISPSISNMSNLESLRLSHNSIEGIIPLEIGKLYRLRTLLIDHNQVSSSLPSVIFNISSLRVISLMDNKLSGSLPLNICERLQGLIRLVLSKNRLSGQIPSTLFRCSQLQILRLYKNKFTGGIPKEIGNMTTLRVLHLAHNNLTGTIPDEFCNLHKLEKLRLGFNSLTGSIPARILNISSLKIAGISRNNLSGNLPSSIGHGFPSLALLDVSDNMLDGVIPASITNASKLTDLDLSRNKFSGPVPDYLGDLRLLKNLALSQNNLISETSSSELSFITQLTNCKYLRKISIAYNPLKGILPTSFGNLSASFERFYAHSCDIGGNIPNGIGNLSNLVLLNLRGNQMTGAVPTTFKVLQKLQALFLNNNILSGPILNIICDLKGLFNIFLSQNKFSGSIPSCLRNVTSLQYLYIDGNLLDSNIPASMWNLINLVELDLSSNYLNSSLPEGIQNLKTIVRIDLSRNHISGYTPISLGGLQSLVSLSLAHNRLQGPIPESFSGMLSLQSLDLSHNHLSGMIPKGFEKLPYLNCINLSFNNLRGEIPSGGPFQNFTSQSFLSNDALCGAPKFLVPPCSYSPHQKLSRKRVIYISCSITAVAAIAITLTILFLRYKRNNKVPGTTYVSPMRLSERISYYELLQATDGYSESNLLGVGSYGSVYKGTLIDGTLVAVKVFKQKLEETHASFISECEVLRNVRHRNLTKVISSCTNLDFRALVFEYMPNGSLEKWLYSHNLYLNLTQRVRIMIDVATALEYLHTGYTTPVVHCDLKPSNILLDRDMVAYVCDFGISKLLDKEQSALHTKTLATLGYIAPEYGLEGLISTRTDVYSFGIVMMETFSRVKPNNEIFSEDLSLKCWIESYLPNATDQVVDANLIRSEDEHSAKKLECILKIFYLSLRCCEDCPRDRIKIKDVVASLEKIKHQLITDCGEQV